MAQLITNLISNVTAPVNYMLMEGLLKAARRNLPYFNGSMPGRLIENRGAYAVEWERIENLAVATTPLGEPTGNATFGNGRDSVNPTVTRLNVAMAKYGNAITLTEEVDLVQVNARAARFMDTLGENAGTSLNTLLQSDILSGVATTRFASGVASAAAIGAAITLSDIQYSVNQLNRNSAMKMFPIGFGSTNIGTAPIRQSYFGICHPDVEEDIRGLGAGNFIPVEQYGGYTPTLVGEFGAAGGVRWCTSEIATITADTGTASANGLRGTSTVLHDVYDCIIYGEEAIGTVGLGEEHAKEIYQGGDRIPAVQLIAHQPGTSGVADMFNEVGSLAWKSFYAGKVLNDTWIIGLKVAASSL